MLSGPTTPLQNEIMATVVVTTIVVILALSSLAATNGFLLRPKVPSWVGLRSVAGTHEPMDADVLVKKIDEIMSMDTPGSFVTKKEETSPPPSVGEHPDLIPLEHPAEVVWNDPAVLQLLKEQGLEMKDLIALRERALIGKQFPSSKRHKHQESKNV